MNPFLLIKAELAASRGSVLAMALVLALALGLGVGVSVTERAVREGTARAADSFDLLVGARGSSVQLLLGCVYLRPQALPLLPAAIVPRLRSQQGVAWAAPLAFGDRWKKSPLVGTTRDMVTLGGTRALSEGRCFGKEHEAVVGHGVSLALGEEFSPVHGQVHGAGEEHGHVHFRVVGRLPATGTPWDSAILVPLKAMWAAHHLLPATGTDAARHLQPGTVTGAGEDGLEAFLQSGREADLPGISAVVVRPLSFAAAYRLRSFWQSGEVRDGRGDRMVATQAFFSGEVLTELYATLGDMRSIMAAMAWAAQGVALAAVVLTACMALRLRRGMLETLRVLGAPRAYLVTTAWCVVIASVLLGCLGGLGFGLALARGVAHVFLERTGIVLEPALGSPELAFTLLSFGAGALCALLPALTSYLGMARSR